MEQIIEYAISDCGRYRFTLMDSARVEIDNGTRVLRERCFSSIEAAADYMAEMLHTVNEQGNLNIG